jgi:hypothetical protein
MVLADAMPAGGWQRVAALRRRSATAREGADGLHQQLALVQGYHNDVLVHASVRQGLPVAETTNGGSAKVWRPWLALLG